jgi:hypothetical protein
MPKAVGVKQLKAKLSEYLRLVKSGGRFSSPTATRSSPNCGRRAGSLGFPTTWGLLDALADSAEITRASRPSAGWT